MEESLYNRIFIGPTNVWLIQLLVQLFLKGVVWVLFLGFYFCRLYSLKCLPAYKNMVPKVEVCRLEKFTIITLWEVPPGSLDA